jgi:hypothetical protein
LEEFVEDKINYYVVLELVQVARHHYSIDQQRDHRPSERPEGHIDEEMPLA